MKTGIIIVVNEKVNFTSDRVNLTAVKKIKNSISVKIALY